MSLIIGRKVPNFTSQAILSNGDVVEEFNFYDQTKNKYVLLFFYPLDFTFVCPTELISINKKINSFVNRNIEVIGISVDSHHSHIAWRNTPIKNGGIGNIKFTLVSDISHTISQSYCVEDPEKFISFRASFILDKDKILKASFVNDISIGRDVNEILRFFDALKFVEKSGNVCPSGWQKGGKSIKPTKESTIEYLLDN